MAKKKIKKKIPMRIGRYDGPYPYMLLNDARYCLVRNIQIKNNGVWDRIREKTGIFPDGGRDASFQGWGESSTYYSHADLTEENWMEEEYSPRLPRHNSTKTIPSATVTSSDVDTAANSELNEGMSGNGNSVVNPSHENDNQKPPPKPSTSTTKQGGKSIGVIVEIDIENNIVENETITLPNSEEISKNRNVKKDIHIKNNFVNKNSSQTVKAGKPKPSTSSAPEEGEIIEIDGDDSLYEVVDLLSDDNDVEITGEEKVNFSPISTSFGSNTDHNEVGNTLRSIPIDECNSGSVDLLKTSLVSSKEIQTAAKCLQMDAVYKCDFCWETCQIQEKMKKHLNDTCHFSASTIKPFPSTGKFQVIQKLSLMAKEHIYKNVVAICPHPECSEIFDTIYTCSMHHRIKHDLTGPLLYGISPVVSRDELTNPCFSLTCPVCQDKMPHSKADLSTNTSSAWFSRHYESCNHHPFDNSKEDCHYICPKCNVAFQDLQAAMCHQVSHQVGPLSHDMKLTVLKTGQTLVLELPEDNKKNANNSVSTTNRPNMSITPGKSSAMDNNNKAIFFIDRQRMSSDKQEADKTSIPLMETGPACSGEDELDGPNMDPVGGNRNDDTILTTHAMKTPETIIEYNKGGKKYMYSCDYCNCLVVTKDKIYQHLLSEDHISASKVLVDYAYKPVSMIDQMSVVNTNVTNQGKIAACPFGNCHKIFPDIYQSNTHMKVCHGSIGNDYGVADVVKSMMVEVPAKHTCPVCNIKCKNHTRLNQHLKWAKHLPEQYRQKGANSPTNLHFICLCGLFFDSYNTAILHLEKKHSAAISNNTRPVGLRAVSISKTVEKRYLLPFPANILGEEKNLTNTVQTLKKMRKGASKKARKRLREEENNMILLLKKQKQF